MNNWKIPPVDGIVAQFVECYWFLHSPQGEKRHDHPKLNPDPNVHLLFTPDTQRFHYQFGAGLSKGQGSHWLFPHCQSVEMDHTQAQQILAIKFHVGALYAMEQAPLLDQCLSLTQRPFPHVPTQQITVLMRLAQSEPEACCAQLDKYLQPWLEGAVVDQHSLLVRSILPLIASTPIAELSKQLPHSQRTLERSFSRVTGLTLKQCQSMLRLERLLEHLYHLGDQPIDWSDVAQQFGFSDQPHLIRYLKRQLGHTPCQYAKQRDFTIDVYGDFEPS